MISKSTSSNDKEVGEVAWCCPVLAVQFTERTCIPESKFFLLLQFLGNELREHGWVIVFLLIIQIYVIVFLLIIQIYVIVFLLTIQFYVLLSYRRIITVWIGCIQE